MGKKHIFKSERGIPLICQGKDNNKPVVTVENYCKWYQIFVIYPDSTVVPADWPTLNKINKSSDKHLIGDHIFHPELLEKFADHIGGYVHDVSLEAVTGRWMFEYHDKTAEEI